MINVQQVADAADMIVNGYSIQPLPGGLPGAESEPP